MEMSCEWMFETHKCCSCGQPLCDHPYTGVNVIQLPYLANWSYPVMGNVLQGTSGIACAVQCDPCLRSKAVIQWAIEYSGKLEIEEAIKYHPVSELKPTEQIIR